MRTIDVIAALIIILLLVAFGALISLGLAGCSSPRADLGSARQASWGQGYYRLRPEDRAMLPREAKLHDWFRDPNTDAIPVSHDPYWDGADSVVHAADHGAIADDGIDDTAAIQAAYDVVCNHVPWDFTLRREDEHGFVLLEPGIYQVTQIHPCPGSTLYGYGATLQRPPWSWFVDQAGGDEDQARIDADSRIRIINGWGYHPRIEYRWRGSTRSPPIRFLGVTLDGNTPNWAEYSDYEFWNAHLATFSAANTDDSINGQLRVELIDVTVKDSPSDCVNVVNNVDLVLRRYMADSCFRGALNSLGNNNRIDGELLYMSGRIGEWRAIDREPQGTSQAMDYERCEDLTQTRRSAAEYWHLRDLVIGGGFDVASSALAPGSPNLVGGSILIERMHSLRSHTLNVIQYHANADETPVLEVRDSFIRSSCFSHELDKMADPDGSWYCALSAIRWSKRVRFVRTRFVLAKPSETMLETFFAQPDLPDRIWSYVLNLDQTTSASIQRPDTLLELLDVSFELDEDWAHSAFGHRFWHRAIYANGNAAQNHRLIWRGGEVKPGIHYALYQFHGGDALLDDVQLDTAAIHGCTYNPASYTSRIERRGLALAAAAIDCTGGQTQWVPPL